MRKTRGLTLIEFTVALALLGVAVVAFLGAFKLVQRSVIKTKNRTLATSLCRERMETLKNKRYVLLRPTELADLTALGYDNTYFPPDIGLSAAGTRFDRYSRVDKVSLASGQVVALSPTATDTGMKRVVVWVEWDEEGRRRHYEMSSLFNNPSRSRGLGGLVGSVYHTPGGFGNELPGATVKLDEDPARSDVSNATGGYWISATSGNYTAHASARGYFDSLAPVSPYPSATKDFTLSARATGGIDGAAFIRDHLVISQVVVSSIAPNGFAIQLVELYNPTTTAMFIGSASSHTVRLRYQSPYLTQDCPDLALQYTVSNIMPLSSYLIADASTFVLAGTTVTADAYFKDTAGAGCSATPTGWAPPATRRIIELGKAGSVVLRKPAGTGIVDAVGWTQGATNPAYCEGSCISLASGLGLGEQLVRRVSSDSLSGAPQGRAFDSNANGSDFLTPATLVGLEMPARSSANGVQAPLTGTPAAGAVVAADDDLSSPVVADASGYFTIPGVATCTALGVPGSWSVTIGSGVYAAVVEGLSPPAGGTAGVGNVVLGSTVAPAVITGTVVSSVGGAIPGIVMEGGGAVSVTDGAGFYRLLVDSGSVSVTANYFRANPGYEEVATTPYAVVPGQQQTVNTTLNPVGNIRGVVTTNGVDPFPGEVVHAEAPPGTVRGTVTTDAAGAFRLIALPASAVAGVGPYTISPAIDSSQVSTPASVSVTLSQSAEVDVGSFTVSSAMGSISGSVSDGGSPITTGVLIMASLASIAGTPPTWDETLRGGSTMYYTTHARNDGSWTLPVRVNASAYNVYAWYSKLDNGVSSTTVKSATKLVSSSSGTFVVSFTWP